MRHTNADPLFKDSSAINRRRTIPACAANARSEAIGRQAWAQVDAALTAHQTPTQLAQMPIQSPQRQPQVQQAQFWQPQAEPAQPEPPAQPQQPATGADQPAVDGPVPGSGHGGANGSGEDDPKNPPSDQGGAEPAPFGGYANPTLAESLVNQAKMNAQKERPNAPERPSTTPSHAIDEPPAKSSARLEAFDRHLRARAHAGNLLQGWIATSKGSVGFEGAKDCFDAVATYRIDQLGLTLLFPAGLEGELNRFFIERVDADADHSTLFLSRGSCRVGFTISA